MDAKCVVGHVMAHWMLEMNVKLVDTGRVVHIGHDLVRCNAGFLKDSVAALRVEFLQHRKVVAFEVPDGLELCICDHRQPV